MRALVCAALFACACRPESAYLDDLAVIDLESACAPGCDNCMSNEVCYGGALPSQPAFLSAVCLAACRTTDDCPAGAHCVLEPSVYGARGPVCMTDALPARCPSSPPPDGCAAVAGCADPRTLSVEFFPASHAICGRELVACPNGCVLGGSDGGAADGGGAIAHCR